MAVQATQTTIPADGSIVQVSIPLLSSSPPVRVSCIVQNTGQYPVLLGGNDQSATFPLASTSSINLDLASTDSLYAVTGTANEIGQLTVLATANTTVTELFANMGSPLGVAAPLATLTEPISSVPAPGTVESYGVSQSAPTELQGTGAQFRVAIDDEILIVSATGNGSSPWAFERGAEGSPIAAHGVGTPIYHVVTAGALSNIAAGSNVQL